MDTLSSFTEVLWGRAGVWLLAACGIYFTLRSGFFQLRALPDVLRAPLGGGSARRGISGFQAICTVLAASIGVGNIAGVAAAIALGGAGAVFWMWVAALLGMITSFAENYLGGIYRGTTRTGERAGGAMYYLRDGVGGKLGRLLAAVFAVCCIFASFGIGNMSQVSAITDNVITLLPCGMSETAMRAVIGCAVALIAALMMRGGLKGVGKVTRILVPVMALAYILGALYVTLSNAALLPSALSCVFRSAFSPRAFTVGGAAGAMAVGFRRGIFSSEAGMGSAVMVNSASDMTPEQQGIFGMFEVFFDTLIMCSLTAFVVLTSGAVDLASGQLLSEGSAMTLVSGCFRSALGSVGQITVTACVVLFALTTIVAWSCYGTACWGYLTEKKPALYRAAYTGAIVLGAVSAPALAWQLSDIFNAFMLFPNLIGVFVLRGKVLGFFRTRKKPSPAGKAMVDEYISR